MSLDPAEHPSWIAPHPRDRLRRRKRRWWRDCPPIRINRWLVLYLSVELTLVPLGCWHVLHDWLGWL